MKQKKKNEKNQIKSKKRKVDDEENDRREINESPM